ncbi:MAG: 30S ribosomal protein S3 [Kiritimatiellae bacterium]|nr:30S ribosomal protein S3 [Kiritimatiellia bacterium]
MGQKVNPIGFRVAIDKQWRSRWFSGKKEFGDLLAEDQKIRAAVLRELKTAAVAKLEIERYAKNVRINVFTARAGFIVGKKSGIDMDKLTRSLAKSTGKKIFFDIHEVRDADVNAQLVAENNASQIEHRVALRRALKRALKVAMDIGVDGIKIRCSGRINNAELSRVEWSKEGKIPLHTLRADIDYGFAEADTTAGKIGVKVWICKPEDFKPRMSPARRKSHAPNA